MSDAALNYLLKDIKNLDKYEMFAKYKKLYTQLELANSENLELRETVAKLKQKLQEKAIEKSKTVSYDGYNKNWVMSKKIVFVLKQNKKPMTARDIVELLLSIEPQLNDIYKEKEKILSNYIYNAVKRGYIHSVDKEVGGGYKYAVSG